MRNVPAEHFCQTLLVNVDNEKLNDADFREFVRNTLGIVKGAEPPCRKRKPLDLKEWKFPPTMSSDDVEKRIDDACGCRGRHDCDCVSVFNQVCRDSWYEHNTKDAK